MGLSDRDELVLGLLAAPGRPTEVAEALAEDLPGLLADRVTDAVSWRVPVRTDPALADMSQGVEAIDLARARLLREGWDMAVCITDAPLRIGRRPVVADASATHGVALISLPALGAVQTRRRARDAVIRLVDGLVGESLELGERGPRRRARVSHRIASLAAPIRAVEPPDDDVDLRFVAAVVRGNLRLLAGMVRANRPWRLIVRLSRALAAAAAAVVFALVTADLWVLADALNWLRLLALTVLSVGATVLWLIVVAPPVGGAARAREPSADSPFQRGYDADAATRSRVAVCGAVCAHHRGRCSGDRRRGAGRGARSRGRRRRLRGPGLDGKLARHDRGWAGRRP